MTSSGPSAWKKRLPPLVLALVGFGIATYLALFQWGILAEVWEPFFGNGSRILLNESPLAHLLPVPDAALGALAYMIEVVAESIGGATRWRTRPVAVFFTGIVAAGLALTAVGLVASQVLWFRAYCTLCLASAICSLAIAAFVVPEVRAAWRHHNEKDRTFSARRESRAPTPETYWRGVQDESQG